MKLAEALILRADYQKRIEQLKQRLVRNAKIQEGDKPAEEPADLVKELEELASGLIDLIQRINRTNAMTELEPGTTLTDALAVRDVNTTRQAVYRELAQAASTTRDRLSRSEIRFKSTVNVAHIQRRADDLAKENRELDTRIQEANWLTDLVE